MDSARRTTVDVQSRHFWEGLVVETEKQFKTMKNVCHFYSPRYSIRTVSFIYKSQFILA